MSSRPTMAKSRSYAPPTTSSWSMCLVRRTPRTLATFSERSARSSGFTGLYESPSNLTHHDDRQHRKETTMSYACPRCGTTLVGRRATVEGDEEAEKRTTSPGKVLVAFAHGQGLVLLHQE